MPIRTRFFRVEKPFRAYRLVGDFLSNTFIGSSQCFENVYEARNVRPGDEIHVLPGGTFHFDASERKWWCLRLDPPRHIFEKTYGFEPDDMILARRGSKGVVTESDYSTLKCDFKAARASVRRLDRPVSPVVEVEKSPEAEEFLAALEPLTEAFRRLREEGVGDLRGEPPTYLFSDIGESPTVHWTFYFGQYRKNPVHDRMERSAAIMVEWAYIPRFAIVAVPAGTTVPEGLGVKQEGWNGMDRYRTDLATVAALVPSMIEAHGAVCEIGPGTPRPI